MLQEHKYLENHSTIILPITFRSGLESKAGFGPDGDTSVAVVRNGNETMRWTMAYAVLAEWMRLWIAIEQPSSSTFFVHPHVLQTVGLINQHRVIWLIWSLN